MSNHIPWKQQFIIITTVALTLFFRAGTVDFLFGDDTALFKNAFDNPLHSIAKPYAGYCQIICRSLASLFMALPLDYTVLSFILAPFISTLIVATTILNMSWLSIGQRKIMALTTVLIPHSSEVYIYLCNTNWILSILPCLFLLIPNLGSIRSARTLPIVTTTSILGLSTVYVPILSPLFAIRFLRVKQKNSGEIVFLAAIILTSAIQTAVVVVNGLTMSATNDTIPAFAPHFSPIVTFINAIFILPVSAYVTSVELLQKALHDIRIFIPSALLVMTMCLGICYLWMKSDKEVRIRSLLFFCLGYYLIIACAVRTINALQLFIPMRGADRYFYLPYFFFTVALTQIITFKNTSFQRKALSCFVVLVLAAFYISEWHITRAPERAREVWQQQVAKLYATGTWDFNPRNGAYTPTENKDNRATGTPSIK